MRTAFSGCLMEAKSNPWDSELQSRGGPSGQNWAGNQRGGVLFNPSNGPQKVRTMQTGCLKCPDG
jgi:hypothetical protein